MVEEMSRELGWCLSRFVLRLDSVNYCIFWIGINFFKFWVHKYERLFDKFDQCVRGPYRI